ncbi:MAG: amidohydrolase [Spirochaetales bacterium]|nr:amidohydrolase [Spirochaetales bacterium]
MKDYGSIFKWLDGHTATYAAVADKIWGYAEVALQELKSAALQMAHLKTEGFTVTEKVAGIKTAFSAERGKGKPVIGFIGEYDALPGLSQKVAPRKDPVVQGAPGHGCGHNLLGTGGLAAAVAVSRWLEENGMEGTVRYYGCPAEEQLWAKAFMARAGSFDDLDAALNFHPATYNMPGKGTAVGIYDVRFKFTGVTAHAGGSPHRGRSALDAVELMNVGVNYLREHVPEKVRMHYAVTDGGRVPNIVPETAAVWYYLRAPDMKILDNVYARVRKVAEGAALMTETRVDIRVTAGCSSVLNNHYLADLHYEVMKDIGSIVYTDEELAFAREINTAYPDGASEGAFAGLPVPQAERDRVEAVGKRPLVDENFPAMDELEVRTGSTDVGDVSWITPLSMLRTTCFPAGVASHSWGATAASGMSIGHKGMMHAAKIMAGVAALLFDEPEHLKKARDEFLKKTADSPYKCPVPPEIRIEDVTPTF